MDVTRTLVVIGEFGVGKTSIVSRLTNHEVDPVPLSTIGPAMVSHRFQISDKETFSLQIVDTAGDERFHSTTVPFMRDAAGALLVYAINDAGSFSAIDNWIDKLQVYSPGAVMVLVGNKSDLAEEYRAVTHSQGSNYCQRHEISFFETSAHGGTNVEEAFARLARAIYDKSLTELAVEYPVPQVAETSQRTCC
jgi:small GTP-binding protein